MSTVLIVGASQGLGLEWVKYYKQQGYNIIATTRNIDAATELKAILTAQDKLLKLDVTDVESVTVAIRQLSVAPEITIYNAGTKGYNSTHSKTRAGLTNARLLDISVHDEASSREAARSLAFEVNTYGFDRLMYALKEHLLNKSQAVVVYISTGAADILQNTSGGYPFYRESKVAGEAFARGWYLEFLAQANPDSCPRIFSIIPGLVDAGMGKGIPGGAKPATRIAEMAQVIDQVKSTGDIHGVWKYDGTKYSQYALPAINN